jgi:hypothetical protein
MGTRADLLKVAEWMASSAANNAQGGGIDNATELVTSAKTALEAAALAENTSAGAIDQALGGIQDLLVEAGVLTESMEMDTTEFMQHTFRALVAWRNETLAAQGYEVGYDLLRDLLEGLERDFIAGDSDVSRRLAARIRARLDDATAVINQGKQRGAESAAG